MIFHIILLYLFVNLYLFETCPFSGSQYNVQENNFYIAHDIQIHLCIIRHVITFAVVGLDLTSNSKHICCKPISYSLLSLKHLAAIQFGTV